MLFVQMKIVILAINVILVKMDIIKPTIYAQNVYYLVYIALMLIPVRSVF